MLEFDYLKARLFRYHYCGPLLDRFSFELLPTLAQTEHFYHESGNLAAML